MSRHPPESRPVRRQGKKVSLLALLSYGKRTTIHVGPVSSERSLDDESTSHILAGDTRRARRASH